MPNREIFVDDVDPDIQYGFGWATQSFNASEAAQLPSFPLYGTLHVFTANSASGGNGNFSYIFNGTSISAFFVPDTPTEAITACVVDGQNATVDTTEGGEVRCESESLLEGTHELFVEVKPSVSSPILFDGVRYTPSGGDTSVGDVVFFAGDHSIEIQPDPTHFASPGAALNFDFFGYSLSLYGVFFDNVSHTPSNGSYTIDDQAPVQFTVSNVATIQNSVVAPTLVLQTQRFPLGEHRFRMDFVGTPSTVSFTFDEIIVQNTTSHVELEPFPPVTTTSLQASPSPTLSSKAQTLSSKSNHLGIAIGVTIGVVVLLSSILGIFWWRRRRRATIIDGEGSRSDVIVRPFNNPPQRPPPHHGGKGGGTFNDRLSHERSVSSAGSTGATAGLPMRRVIIHTDSEDLSNELSSLNEIIELPPIYRSVRRTQR